MDFEKYEITSLKPHELKKKKSYQKLCLLISILKTSKSVLDVPI